MDIITFMATSRRYLETTIRSDKAEFGEEQKLMTDNIAEPATSFGSRSRRIGDKVEKWNSGNLEIGELDNFDVWISGKVEHRRLGGVQDLFRTKNSCCHT